MLLNLDDVILACLLIDKTSVTLSTLAEVQYLLSPAGITISRGLNSDHLVNAWVDYWARDHHCSESRKHRRM